MSAVGPLSTSTAETLYFPAEEMPGPSPPAVAGGTDARDVITLSPRARMLLAVSEMLAQAEGGADTAVSGRVLDVLSSIQELAQVPAPDDDTTAQVAGNSGSTALGLSGDGSGVTAVREQPTGGVSNSIFAQAAAGTAAQRLPLDDMANIPQVAAAQDDASASQSLQGDGIVVAAVPEDGTAANASGQRPAR